MEQISFYVDAVLSLVESEGTTVRYVVVAALAFLVIFTSQLLSWQCKKILARILKKAAKTQTLWDDVLLDSAVHPLQLAIKLTGVLIACSIILHTFPSELFSQLVKYAYILHLPLAAWFIMRFVNGIEKGYVAKASEQEKDITTYQVLGKLVRISVLIVTTLIILQTLGVNIAGLIAAGGVGGIVLGFAAQDLLANFFGGLMLFLERPFRVGDWIRSPDREIEGIVEEVGLRTTTIRTFDLRPLYVPNSVFTKIAVENPSRMRNRRIFETIGVRYQDATKIEGILRTVRSYLRGHKDIDAKQILMVNFNSFAPSSLDFFIYCFTKTCDWQQYHIIKEDVLLHINALISEAGAEIAYPTNTVHIEPPIEIPT